jgi:sucrose-6-phosphate hydrolase SacC (GH32 family)
VFYGGNGLHLLGRFDGQTFTAEAGPLPLHHGNCFYASQTFNDAPDGRRVVIGWGTVSMPQCR